jgi:hypothetical protein
MWLLLLLLLLLLCSFCPFRTEWECAICVVEQDWCLSGCLQREPKGIYEPQSGQLQPLWHHMVVSSPTTPRQKKAKTRVHDLAVLPER